MSTHWLILTVMIFSFSLLLPDGDNGIEDRTQALGQWCSGFISGYGQASVSRDGLSEDASSALTDIAQISQVQAEEMEETEETERDFFEVCEYVRLAVLMLFSEQHNQKPPSQPSQQSSSLH